LSNSAELPQSILEKSYPVHSADTVEQSINKLANLINQDFDDSPLVLMCVMTGGLYFSAKLLPLLKMPVELDYVQASRYQHTLKGQSLAWTKQPNIDLNDKTVLLVDDILDEGVTLDAVAKRCIELGAKNVATAVLVDKKNCLDKPIKPNYVGLSVPDAFVFGCGMDVYGWWRNLAEIRAIHPPE